MKREYYYIIIGVGAFILYKMMRKNGDRKNDKAYVFGQVAKRFGKPIARSVEKIYRLETGHFKKGFDGVYGAGMHPVTTRFPYGWTSLQNFWLSNPEFKPSGIVKKTEGKGLAGDGGGVKSYLQFPNFLAGAMTVAKRMQIVGNNPGAWYSRDPDRQQRYNTTVARIQSSFVDNIV